MDGARKEAILRRRRIKRQIRREALERLQNLPRTSTMREIYAPRVIFGMLFVLFAIGGLLIGRAGRAAENSPERQIPHLTAVNSLDVLATALGRYRMHVGRFPSGEEGLLALNKDFGTPGWLGPYLVELKPDPWGRPYNYGFSGEGLPRLFSSGPDGIAGTKDDLYPGEEFFDPGTAWTNGWKRKEERLPAINLPQ